MRALCNCLTRRYLRSNSHNKLLTVRSCRNKQKKIRNKILSHIINVQSKSLMMSLDKTKSVYTSLYYLSQVKINVTTVNNICFLPYSRHLASSSSFSRTVATHWAREAISFLACNLAKCWVILKFFYTQTQQWICSKLSLKMPQYLKYLAAVQCVMIYS